MIMNDSDKVKYLLELAELHRKQFDTRRQVEWKINFAFWTAVGLVAYFYCSRDTGLSWCERIVVASGLVLAGFFYAVVHLPAIFGAEDKDLDFMIYFKDCAEAVLLDPENLPDKPAALAEHEVKKPGWCYAWKHGGWYYMLCMILVSLGIVLAVVLLLLCRVRWVCSCWATLGSAHA
jgi:hypothetical protein